MLRFDVPPVLSNVTRFEAFLTFAFCAIALFYSPWVMVLPVAQGAVRGFVGHYRCPSHLLFRRVFTALGIQGKPENAGAKMFANKVLFVVSSIVLALFLAGSPLWKVPCVALMIFATMEWAFSFCAACWVYGAWYKRFPPAST